MTRWSTARWGTGGTGRSRPHVAGLSRGAGIEARARLGEFTRYHRLQHALQDFLLRLSRSPHRIRRGCAICSICSG